MSSNPFVVDQLSARSSTGQSQQTYELTKASVSPSRIIGRDARGLPIEDTEPTTKWAPFLSADGCINKVPLRTGSVPSNHADAIAYENETLYDLVVAGWIPAHLCPYSTKFSYITGGAFVADDTGQTDCGGSSHSGGCQHLQAVGKLRREFVKENYDREMAIFSQQRDEEHARLRSDIVEGVGAAIAKHVAPPAQQRSERAQRMRDGKGEE